MIDGPTPRLTPKAVSMPIQMRLAVVLMWGLVALSAMEPFVQLLTGAETFWSVIVGLVLFVVPVALLVWYVMQGHNWARTIFALVAGFFLFVDVVISLTSAIDLRTTVSLITGGVVAATLVLLFCSASNEWFKSVVVRREAARADEFRATAESMRPIWNPDAAAAWSLLLFPIFGAVLVGLNWRQLGEPTRAKWAFAWAFATPLIFALLVLLGVTLDRRPGAHAIATVLTGALLFAYYACWYFISVRRQAAYVNDRFGSNFRRRGWLWALVIGFCGRVLVRALSNY